MCGIMAWVGKNPKKFDKGKFDILGIFNDERGGHSCGVSVDGSIKIGIDGNKLYKKFISTNPYNTPLNVPTVIGHTRKATGGAHNKANAHPFGFGSVNAGKSFAFIGVHNGSLINERDLAKEFGIASNAKVGNVHRNKIDSEILLECIYKSKNFKVLNQYIGAAALVFQRLDEPNVVYCYHGESKMNYYDKKTVEERPLFYYQETRNSLYISSIENSLTTIGGEVDKDIFSFDTNTIYKITDGDVSKAIKTKIVRTDMYQKYTYIKNKTEEFVPDSCATEYQNRRNAMAENYKNRKRRANSIDGIQNSHQYNLHYESVYTSGTTGNIYFSCLRYLRNGHPVTGVCTFIKGYGFYKLGEDIKKANQYFFDLVGRKFLEKDFITTNTVVKKKDRNKVFVPFPSVDVDKYTVEAPLFYLYKGIRVLDELDYTAALMRDKEGTPFSVLDMSECSTHPILTFNIRDRQPSISQNIVFRGKKFSGIVTPIGSKRIYTIDEGNCIEFEDIGDAWNTYNKTKHLEVIEDSEEDIKRYNLDGELSDESIIESACVILDLDSIKQEIEFFETNISKSENTQLSIFNNDDKSKVLDKELTKMLLPILSTFPANIRTLETDFKDDLKAKSFIKIFKQFIDESSNISLLENVNK